VCADALDSAPAFMSRGAWRDWIYRNHGRPSHTGRLEPQIPLPARRTSTSSGPGTGGSTSIMSTVRGARRTAARICPMHCDRQCCHDVQQLACGVESCVRRDALQRRRALVVDVCAGPMRDGRDEGLVFGQPMAAVCCPQRAHAESLRHRDILPEVVADKNCVRKRRITASRDVAKATRIRPHVAARNEVDGDGQTLPARRRAPIRAGWDGQMAHGRRPA
jgi:hypothetical protein